MKILIFHNSYRHRGGEDGVVEAETALLRDAGHDVQLALIGNDELSSVGERLRVFARAPFDPSMAAWARSLVETHAPDVVHVHNFFPRLTPAIHQAASEAGATVIQTLHNYRLICAGAFLLRDGAVCEKCLHGSAAWGVYHRCYRGSAAASLAVVRMQERAWRQDVWSRYVHRFIALTEFARSKFIEAGLPAELISVKPNFVPAVERPPPAPERRAVYVGRLSPEKGVHLALDAWGDLPHLPLHVIGDGPQGPALHAAAPSNVTFAGALAPAEVREQLANSLCLVVPSIWYEGFPLVVIEALEAGVPVVASRIGSLAEVVRHEVNGLLFDPGDPRSLRAAVTRLSNDSALLATLSRGAREDYKRNYTPQRNLEKLLCIYTEALENPSASK